MNDQLNGGTARRTRRRWAAAAAVPALMAGAFLLASCSLGSNAHPVAKATPTPTATATTTATATATSTTPGAPPAAVAKFTLQSLASRSFSDVWRRDPAGTYTLTNPEGHATAGSDQPAVSIAPLNQKGSGQFSIQLPSSNNSVPALESGKTGLLYANVLPGVNVTIESVPQGVLYSAIVSQGASFSGQFEVMVRSGKLHLVAQPGLQTTAAMQLDGATLSTVFVEKVVDAQGKVVQANTGAHMISGNEMYFSVRPVGKAIAYPLHIDVLSTWFQEGPRDRGRFALSVDPVRSGTIYATNFYSGRVWRSTDGGSDWTSARFETLPAPSGDGWVWLPHGRMTLTQDSAGNLFVLYGFESIGTETHAEYLSESTDHGRHWTTMKLPTHAVRSPACTSNDVEYHGLAAASPADLWTIGVYGCGGPTSQTVGTYHYYIVHYDGRHWSVKAALSSGWSSSAWDYNAADARTALWYRGSDHRVRGIYAGHNGREVVEDYVQYDPATQSASVHLVAASKYVHFNCRLRGAGLWTTYCQVLGDGIDAYTVTRNGLAWENYNVYSPHMANLWYASDSGHIALSGMSIAWPCIQRGVAGYHTGAVYVNDRDQAYAIVEDPAGTCMTGDVGPVGSKDLRAATFGSAMQNESGDALQLSVYDPKGGDRMYFPVGKWSQGREEVYLASMTVAR